MIEINVAKEFNVSTGARTPDDGKLSGQEFYEKLLKPKYESAIASNDILKVILDGTDGMASSFINEAFRRLGAEFGADNVWKNLLLVSDEVPKYITKIKTALYENKK